MDLHTLRQTLRFKPLYEVELRVTFYARVSTESDVQLNSLENQVSYYEEFIRKIPCWTYVPGYVDEGLSGISTKKREEFNRMIQDSADGLFDLILTKEITRFARNTLDSIKFTRELLSNNVGVLFQNDNICTFDEDSELRLAIMSSIAQDELRKLSSRVRFGHQQAIKNGVVMGNNNLFGYRKHNKRLVIHEEEAEMVRKVYSLYATGRYSMRQIEKVLFEQGYRNRRGNIITHSTLGNILTNPKYKGYYCGNKVKVIDMFTKKQKFLPPEEWVMYKDETGESVPAIVSEELWDTVNAIILERGEDVKSRKGICNHPNLLTGKLYCTHCNSLYYRKKVMNRMGDEVGFWLCSHKIRNGAQSCPSFSIYEYEFKPLLHELFRDTDDIALTMIEEYRKMYEAIRASTNFEKRTKEIQAKLQGLERHTDTVIRLYSDKQITLEEMQNLRATYKKESDDLHLELMELQSEKELADEFNYHMERIKRTFRTASIDFTNGDIDNIMVKNFIDRIDVTPIDATTAKLEIKLFFGEPTEKFIDRLKRRSNTSEESVDDGNCNSGCNPHFSRMVFTVKKMIEAYEQGMQ